MNQLPEKTDSSSDETDSPSDESLRRYGRKIDKWRRDSAQVGSQAHRAAVWVRALLLGMLIVYTVFSWLLGEPPRQPSLLDLIVAGSSCFALTVAMGAVPTMIDRWRVRRLKTQRIALGVERVSCRANELLRRGLRQVYQRLLEELRLLRAPLLEAISRLENWAIAEKEPIKIPPDAHWMNSSCQPASTGRAKTIETCLNSYPAFDLIRCLTPCWFTFKCLGQDMLRPPRAGNATITGAFGLAHVHL